MIVKSQVTDCPHRLVPKSEQKRKKKQQPQKTPEPNSYRSTADMWTEEDGIRFLAETGVPIGPDGTPLGIGWDD